MVKLATGYAGKSNSKVCVEQSTVPSFVPLSTETVIVCAPSPSFGVYVTAFVPSPDRVPGFALVTVTKSFGQAPVIVKEQSAPTATGNVGSGKTTVESS